MFGSPDTVRSRLEAMAAALGIDEVMIVTIVHDHAARLRSYELLAGIAAAHASDVSRLATAGS